MKAPVCFIVPPSPFLLDERVFVSLGVLKVAAAHRARGNPVEVLDLSGVSNAEQVAGIHAIGKTDEEWFAITATTPQMPATARIIQAIREESNAKIMLGGPHPTLVSAAAKLQSKRGAQLERARATKALAQLRDLVDVVVAGDGEDAIEQALRIGRGLVDADDPKGPLFLTSKRLEEMPWPARDLVDLDSYHYEIDGVRATTLVAQLGCPFGCTFCGGRNSAMLRRIRTRSTENILAELEHLHTAHGYCGFMFYDDELNVNREMVPLMKGITALQRRLGVEFRLRGFTKAELFTAEQAEAMYEAGFRQLLTGFEAAHPRILENIQKKATVEDNTRCVQLAKAAGLRVKALMSIGHAGESEETVLAVRDWLLEVKPEDFDCTIITPYPGSPYYDDAVPAFGFRGGARPCRAEHDGLDGHMGCGRPAGHGPLWPSTPNEFVEGHYRYALPHDMEPVWTYTAPGSGDRLHAFEIDYTKEADYYKGKPGGGYVSHVFTDHLSPGDLVRLRDQLEAEVREKLGIPFNAGAAALQFEASMGQLPSSIYRSSTP